MMSSMRGWTKWQIETIMKTVGGKRRNNDGELHQSRMEGVKPKIPSFKGKGDLEAYLEWELKIEYLFSYYNYTKE